MNEDYNRSFKYCCVANGSIDSIQCHAALFMQTS